MSHGATRAGYVANNLPRILSYSIWAALNIAMAAYAAIAYRDASGNVQIARAAGAVINFNAAYCLVPMMRLFISTLRRTRWFRFLALEDSIVFHRLAGYTIAVAALVHTIAYVAIFASRPTMTLLEHFGASRAARTGCMLVPILALLWLLALRRVHKRWPYEVFLAAHALAIPFVLILLAHSPNYWKWFAVGGAGYLADRGLRFWRMRTPSEIVTARELPSRVTELAILRPPEWTFRSGDFVWLLIPSVSRLEWHPFTISSPPERADTFTVHIRTLGDWTAAVHHAAPSLSKTKLYFDGPHGAPANDIFDRPVAVLVAAGIGVTPFASILQSLLARRDSSAMTRVYFYWINRDHHAFEWFTEMLAELGRQDATGMFEIHLYITEPPPGALPAMTTHGKPDWTAELDRIHAAHASTDIGFFYCGPRGLARTLRVHCGDRGWLFKEEHF